MAIHRSQPRLPRKIRAEPLAHPFKRSPLQFRDKPATKNAPLDRQLRRILQPIFEEAPSPRNRSRASARDPFFDLQEERDQDRDDYDEYNERDGPVFPWEDEKTLVSDLMNGYQDDEPDEDEQLTSLADSIHDSMIMHSKELSEDAAEHFIPAVNHVKDAHQALEDNVDHTLGIAMLEFDEACKNVEVVTKKEFDDLQKSYRDGRLRIQDLFKQLQEAYARRDQLWHDLDKALDETVNPTLNTLKDIPTRMERAITAMDKQSKQIHKDSGHNGKALKGLLSKLV